MLWSPCCVFLNVPFTCGSGSCFALSTVVTLTLPPLRLGTSKESAGPCRHCLWCCLGAGPFWSVLKSLLLTPAGTTQMFSCHCSSSHSLEAQGSLSVFVVFTCLSFQCLWQFLTNFNLPLFLNPVPF